MSLYSIKSVVFTHGTTTMKILLAFNLNYIHLIYPVIYWEFGSCQPHFIMVGCLCYFTQRNDIYMANEKKEVVPGLTSADIKKIAEKVFDKTNGNHPHARVSGNSFIEILEKGKSDISFSPVFLKKASL